MNTRRNAGRRIGKADVGGNKDPPQAPSAGVQVHVKPAALMDGKEREALVQMDQAITTQTRVITS